MSGVGGYLPLGWACSHLPHLCLCTSEGLGLLWRGMGAGRELGPLDLRPVPVAYPAPCLHPQALP